MTDQTNEIAQLQGQVTALQDMIRALENQRNAAQNECVQLAVQVHAFNRKLTELEAKPAAPALDDKAVEKTKKNGKVHGASQESAVAPLQ
jgi:predicted  nucleic acid-binding Zn-ribbon protein